MTREAADRSEAQIPELREAIVSHRDGAKAYHEPVPESVPADSVAVECVQRVTAHQAAAPRVAIDKRRRTENDANQ